MDDKLSELKTIFDFVREHPGCTARQIGKVVPGGKSRANHFLYGYADILFKKRGLTPPQWNVMTEEAFAILVGRAQPEPAKSERKPSPFDSSSVHGIDPTHRRELLPITICQSCGLPIKPTGACGCS